MGRVSLSADIKYIAVLAVLRVALVASAIIMILLLCQCYTASSDLENLTAAMSEPVTFKQFICCNCHGVQVSDARIGTTFFATRRAMELHISRSCACKAVGKGASTATMV